MKFISTLPLILAVLAVSSVFLFGSPGTVSAESSYSQNFDDLDDGDTDLGDDTLVGSNDGFASVQNGSLELTVDGEGGQAASWKIESPGPEIAESFEVSFDLALSAEGTPADGFSFNVGPIAFDETVHAGEEGFLAGLAVEFDTYNNSGEGAANGIGIDISVDGETVTDGEEREAAGANPKDNRFFKFDGEFRKVQIFWVGDGDAGGEITVVVDDEYIFEDLPVADFVPNEEDILAFGARTGGATESVLIDNFAFAAPTERPARDPKIQVSKTFDLGLVEEGKSITEAIVVSNRGASEALEVSMPTLTGAQKDSFSILTALPITVPAGGSSEIEVTFSSGDFLGSNRATLTFATNDSSDRHQSKTIELTASVIPSAGGGTASYAQDFDGFDNGVTELGDGSTLNQNHDSAGVQDDAMQLTLSGKTSLATSFILPSLGEQATQSWSASMHIALDGGGTRPADGFSFNFGPILDSSLGNAEEGFGTGLAVEFDTYDNNGEGADNGIGIDISVDAIDAIDGSLREEAGADPTNNQFYQFDGEFRLAEITYEQTGDDTASFSLTWDGEVLFENLELEAITPEAGWRFGFSARTGGASETLLIDDLNITAPLVKPVVYAQDFDAFEDGTRDFGDGSSVENGDGVTAVIGKALRLTALETGSTQTAFKMPSLGAQPASLGFSAYFDVALETSGTPADGFSFNFGPINAGDTGNEEGFGKGLAVEFDTYDNDAERGAFGTGIGVDVSVDGQDVPNGLSRIDVAEPKDNNRFFKFDGESRLFEVIWTPVDENGGLLDVSIDGEPVYEMLPVPFVPGATDIPAFAARTGGAKETVLIDNIEISSPPAGTNVRDPKIGGERSLAMATDGGSTVSESLWIMNEGVRRELVISEAMLAGADAAAFSVITTLPLTIAPGESGAIEVQFTAPQTIGSSSATLSLSNNDSLDRAQSFGIELTGFVTPPGGRYFQDFDGIADDTRDLEDGSVISSTFEGSSSETARVFDGALTLTEDGEGSSQAAYKTPAMGTGVTRGFTATFDVALTASGTPADGFSFNYGNIDEAGEASEEGFGRGLTVAFDTYNNDGEGEDTGIGIDVKVNGGDVPDGRLREPLEINDDGYSENQYFLFDEEFHTYTVQWVPTESGGEVTVLFGEEVIYENLPTPGLEPGPSWRFAWSARTGGATEGVQLDNINLAPGGGASAPGLEFTKIEYGAPQGVPPTRSVTLTWRSKPGRTYIMVASPDLKTRDELEDGIESAGEETSFTETGVPAETVERYYYVEEEEQ